MKKRMLAHLRGDRRRSPRGDVLDRRGDWQLALALFVIGNIGVAASFVFYESLLPHIAAPTEMDRVSTAGYAHRVSRRRRAARVNLPGSFSVQARSACPDAGTRGSSCRS